MKAGMLESVPKFLTSGPFQLAFWMVLGMAIVSMQYIGNDNITVLRRRLLKHRSQGVGYNYMPKRWKFYDKTWQ